MLDLAKQVRIFRAAHDLTQKQLAKRLKISQTALSMLESGKPVPQLTDTDLSRVHAYTKEVK